MELMDIVPASTLSPAARRAAVAMLRDAGNLEFFSGTELPDYLNENLLVAVGPDNDVLGSMLLECMEGACANVWGPAWRLPPQSAHVRLMQDAAVRHLGDRSVRIVQALRSVGTPADELAGLGLRHITRMWSMSRWPDAGVPPVGSPRLEFVRQDVGISDEFRKTLLETFTDSLDCPEWNGLRSPDEVIAAHQGAAPDPTKWWLVTDNNEPVGVLIMADVEGMELSYTGVTPAHRRRGFLKSIMRYAIREAGTSCLHLLVDVRNEPAWKTYVELGFRRTRERELYLGNVQLT